MHQLRNHHIVKDKRLDRIPLFDNRSRMYRVADQMQLIYTPKTKVWTCPTVLDQGEEGACVGFGMAHELISAPVETKNVTNQFAHDKIYWEAQKIDPWPGGSYPGADPVYEGTSVLSGAKVMVNQLKAASKYVWGFSLDDLIMGVSHYGPAVLGINWYEGMFDPDMHGFVAPSGIVAGGHCILCLGVNILGKFFVLQNSWGVNWGIVGRCFISYDNMERLLYEQGETLFFVRQRKITV